MFNAAYVKTVIVLMNMNVYKTSNDEDPSKNKPNPIDLLVMVYWVQRDFCFTVAAQVMSTMTVVWQSIS